MDHLLHYIEQNIFSFGPPNYSHRSLEFPAPTPFLLRLVHNLALFSIYGNDGTTVSKKGVIINLKKCHWEKVQKGIPLSSNKLFSLNKQ